VRVVHRAAQKIPHVVGERLAIPDNPCSVLSVRVVVVALVSSKNYNVIIAYNCFVVVHGVNLSDSNAVDVLDAS
jgi:hypothetical protein